MVLASLAFAAIDSDNFAPRNNRDQFRPGQYYNDKNNGRYYKNRQLHQQRRFYDNFFRKYNPQVEPQQAKIVEENIVPIQEDGSYGYMYQTDNGIHNEVQGSATTLDNGDISQKVDGSFSFITPEGIRVVTRYVADENGYRPIITCKDFVNELIF